MAKLFILGAGFSKAVHNGMPLLNDLSQNLNWKQLRHAGPKHKRLRGDIEQLLSYLYQEMPWKLPQERHLDMSLFYGISQLIADYISRREEEAFKHALPAWSMDFVEYLHRTQTTVVTLNYDTVLERLTGMLPANVLGSRDITVPTRTDRDLVLDDLYQVPILPLEERTRNPLGKKSLPTYRLLKPHGSINWYSLGNDESTASEIFYDGVPGFYPDGSTYKKVNKDDDDWAGYKALRENNKRDLVPLIIPPVAEKSSFYRSHMVKMLWSEFAKATEVASEIYFVGYSLPKTDLSMRLFLTSLIGDSGKDVFLVNRDSSGSLKLNYAEVLAGCNWRDDYLGHANAVEMMVNGLKSERQQKLDVAHELALKHNWLRRCPKCHGYAISHKDIKSRNVTIKAMQKDVYHLFKMSDVLVSVFKGNQQELMFMIRELDLNRGSYSWKCSCGHLS